MVGDDYLFLMGAHIIRDPVGKKIRSCYLRWPNQLACHVLRLIHPISYTPRKLIQNFGKESQRTPRLIIEGAKGDSS
jgi:hypothetical protein